MDRTLASPKASINLKKDDIWVVSLSSCGVAERWLNSIPIPRSRVQALCSNVSFSPRHQLPGWLKVRFRLAAWRDNIQHKTVTSVAINNKTVWKTCLFDCSILNQMLFVEPLIRRWRKMHKVSYSTASQQWLPRAGQAANLSLSYR